MWGRGPCLNFKPLRILNGETWWKGEETRIYSDLKTEDDGNTFFSTQPNHWSCRPPDESRNQPRSTTASGWQPSSVWLTLPCHEDLHIFLIVSKMDNGAFSNCFPKKCVALKLETAKRFLSKTTKLWHKRIPGACQGGIRFTSWSDIFLHDIFSCQQITAALNIEELGNSNKFWFFNSLCLSNVTLNILQTCISTATQRWLWWECSHLSAIETVTKKAFSSSRLRSSKVFWL